MDPIPRLNAALEGRYRVERELGRGGMATVYLAEDLKHERRVALKVLKPELAAVMGADRFLAEIKTTANLQHPHILPLHDSGEADGLLFYVMPWVQGESLRARLDREHQLPIEDAVRIATNLAEALDYAHRQGVIHRDIKPANILLQDGKPVISDFGIALAVSAGGGGRLTETGLSLGTPHYMSPEQAAGDHSIGAATDVWALGCVLYEMLVGEPPFTGSTHQAVLGRIITATSAPVSEVRSSVPRHVEAAIATALQRIPADRFRSAGEFAAALTNPGYGASSAQGASRSRAFGWPVVAGLVSVPMLVLLASKWTGESGSDRPLRVFELAYEASIDHGVALSPDGATIVAGQPHGRSGAPIRLWFRSLGSLGWSFVPGSEGIEVHSPKISPDGERVIYHVDGDIRISRFDGGATETLVRGAQSSPWWGSDGFVYYSDSIGAISRVRATGGEPESVTSRRPGETAHAHFQLLPSGTAGVFAVWREDGARLIEWIDLGTGERRVVTEGLSPTITATDVLLFSTLDGDLRAAPLNPKAGELTAPAVTVATGLYVYRNNFAHLAYAGSGDLAYVTGSREGENAGFVWVTREGLIERLDEDERFDPGEVTTFLQLSRGDGRVAFQRMVDGMPELWLKDLPDGPMNRVVYGDVGERLSSGIWSPDGRSVTYFSGPTSQDRNVWSRRVDGVLERQLVLDSDRPFVQGSWSTDGSWLVMRTGANAAMGLGNRDIYGFRPSEHSDAVPLVVTEAEEGSPTISPDGRWLAYSSNETGRFEVFVRPFPDVDSTRVRISVEGGISPIWAHSGREIFFLDEGEGRMMTASFDSESGRTSGARPLFALPEGVPLARGSNFFDVSEDDQRFLFVQRIPELEETARLRVILVENFEATLAGLFRD